MTRKVFYWLLGTIGAAIVTVIVVSVIVGWRSRQGKATPGFTTADYYADARAQIGKESPAIYPTADTQSIYVTSKG